MTLIASRRQLNRFIPASSEACYCSEQAHMYAVLYLFPMYATAKIYAVYVLAIYAKKTTYIYRIYYTV